MILIDLVHAFLVVTIILGAYAIVRYRFPDTLPGRVSSVLV